MTQLIDQVCDYSVRRGITKTAGRGVLGLVAYGLVTILPFIPADKKLEAGSVVYLGLEFLRNLLKQKRPSLFSWL